jgi:hypothetical protein
MKLKFNFGIDLFVSFYCLKIRLLKVFVHLLIQLLKYENLKRKFPVIFFKK